MFRSCLHARASSIGCFVSNGAVWMVQLQRDRARSVHACTASFSISDADGTGEQCCYPDSASLLSAVRGAPFVGRSIVLGAPPEFVVYRRMFVAPMPEVEIAKAIYWQITNEIDDDPDEYCVDYYMVGNLYHGGRRRHELIVVTAAEGRLREYVSCYADANLNVNAVDTVAGALARSITSHEVSGGSDSACLIVHLDPKSPIIVAAYAGAPRLVHRIAHSLVAENGRSLEQTARQLMHAINASARYLGEMRSGAFMPSFACVVGAGSSERSLLEAMRATNSDLELRLVEEAMAPAHRELLVSAGGELDCASWTIALGLALYDCPVEASEVLA